MSYVIGETFIRRAVNAPPGTKRQREAWARATGLDNVALVAQANRVHVYFLLDTGRYKWTNTAFQREWERP